MKDTDIESSLDDIDPWLDQIDQRFNEMQQLIVAEGERTRRHIDLFAAHFQSDLTRILENHAALRDDNADVSRLEAVAKGQERLEFHILATEARASSVEKTQKIVLTEVRSLATKIDRLARGRNRPTRL